MVISQELFELLGAIIVPSFLLLCFGIALMIQKSHEPKWFTGYEKQQREHRTAMNKEHLFLYWGPVIIVNIAMIIVTLS